jgi:hypothetical protein
MLCVTSALLGLVAGFLATASKFSYGFRERLDAPDFERINPLGFSNGFPLMTPTKCKRSAKHRPNKNESRTLRWIPGGELACLLRK